MVALKSLVAAGGKGCLYSLDPETPHIPPSRLVLPVGVFGSCFGWCLSWCQLTVVLAKKIMQRNLVT